MKTEKTHITISPESRADFMAIVCKTFSQTLEFDESDLFSAERTQDKCQKRQALQYVLRTYYLFSHSEIGHFFRKDHSTIIHACKVVSNYLETDKYFFALVNTALNCCKSVSLLFLKISIDVSATRGFYYHSDVYRRGTNKDKGYSELFNGKIF